MAIRSLPSDPRRGRPQQPARCDAHMVSPIGSILPPKVNEPPVIGRSILSFWSPFRLLPCLHASPSLVSSSFRPSERVTAPLTVRGSVPTPGLRFRLTRSSSFDSRHSCDLGPLDFRSSPSTQAVLRLVRAYPASSRLHSCAAPQNIPRFMATSHDGA